MESTVLEILGQWGVLLIGIIFIIIAYAGSILPALPGVPFAALAVLLVHIALPHTEKYSWVSLTIVAVLTIGISILDFVIPVLGTKKYGGSKAGVRGSTVGLIVGFLISIFTSGIGILAIILGPFFGAYIGEKYFAGADNKTALASAWGRLVGFMAGTAGKLIVVTIITIIFVMGAMRLF
mgnify:CR=1 FL=1